MNLSEAARLIHLFSEYWPSAPLTKENVALWARAIDRYDPTDVAEAAALLGESRQWMPSLAEFIEGIKECRRDRLMAEAKARPVLTPSTDDMNEPCSFAEFLRDFPEWRERVLALGDKQTPEDRRVYGQHPIVAGLGYLIETDTYQSEVVHGRTTAAKLKADALAAEVDV
jgi:hypothetical protein